MILRLMVAGAAMVAAVPASAAFVIGTQIADTRLSGTVGGEVIASDGSDAAGAGGVSAGAQLVERVPNGGAFVRAVSSVVAEATSAGRGRVTFRRTLSPGIAASVQSTAANYRYLFETDAPGAFQINWGVAAYGVGTNGAAPGQALSLVARGGTEVLLSLDMLGDGASGQREVPLAAGRYELRIFDAVAPVAAAGETGGLSSQYSFAIRSVPEPETWAMLTIGFATVGVALRRRRTKPTAA